MSFLDDIESHYGSSSKIDASIIYADYYYIEALLRRKAISLGSRLS